jgi:hypothetical protein
MEWKVIGPLVRNLLSPSSFGSFRLVVEKGLIRCCSLFPYRESFRLSWSRAGWLAVDDEVGAMASFPLLSVCCLLSLVARGTQVIPEAASYRGVEYN